MTEASKSSSLKRGLVLGLLVLISTGIFAVFVPIVACPACAGQGHFQSLEGKAKIGKYATVPADCPECGKTGKVPLLKKFLIVPIDPSSLPSNPFK